MGANRSKLVNNQPTTNQAPPECSGGEAVGSFVILVFLVIWVLVLAALGAVVAAQPDPNDSLRDGTFWFSILTYPVFLFGTLLWIWLSRCTVAKVCADVCPAAPTEVEVVEET